MSINQAERQRDQRVLRAIELRIAGYTTARIGIVLGMPRNSVISATRAVREADLAESGEAAGFVEAAYGWDTGSGVRSNVRQ